MRAAIALVLLLSVLSGFNQASARILTPVQLAAGLERPTAIAHAGDGSGRLFIAEQTGRVLVVRDGSVLAVPFLDVSNRISCCGERGLLGIAFHPNYTVNGEFFINYTDTDGDTVVSRLRVSADPDVANSGSEEILLTVAQPFSNHNGGHLAFGPDGYLYIGLGDGGSGGDPQNNAQNRLSLLGKMLRIDVDGAAPYAIPPDNPFVADGSTADEIWALGLRNPFRYSFDRITGDLFIADVGQDAIEEVNVHPANTTAGDNYGWRLMEGSQCFNPVQNCNDGSLTLPEFEYSHSQGRCSITGGYRYRGTRNAALRGYYVFGDFCSGEIFGARETAPGNWEWEVLLDTGLAISSFGEDEAGELYVADVNGTVQQLVAPLAIAPADGVYVSSQFIDLVLTLRVANVEIAQLTAVINGSEVSADVNNCIITGQLDSGGTTRRCPALPMTLLEPGNYELEVMLVLDNSEQVGASVNWTVLANTEQ